MQFVKSHFDCNQLTFKLRPFKFLPAFHHKKASQSLFNALILLVIRAKVPLHQRTMHRKARRNLNDLSFKELLRLQAQIRVAKTASTKGRHAKLGGLKNQKVRVSKVVLGTLYDPTSVSFTIMKNCLNF